MSNSVEVTGIVIGDADELVSELISEGEEEPEEEEEDEIICYCCSEPLYNDDYSAVIAMGAKGELEIAPYCEDCHDGNTFYCDVSHEYYDADEFSSGQDEDYDTICVEYAQQNGYIRVPDEDAEEGYLWLSPEAYVKRVTENKEDNPENPVATAYSDFYWRLPASDKKTQNDAGKENRVLVLMHVDGPEHSSDSNKTVALFVEKIVERIEKAGADRGDYNVLLTYTRLELIDQGILPPDYVL